MLQLKREPDNSVDRNAVAVVKIDGSIVGHVLYNLAPTFSRFLKGDFNKAIVEITGDKVNRGAGYRLELPCKDRLYDPKLYMDKLQEIIVSLCSKCLI